MEWISIDNKNKLPTDDTIVAVWCCKFGNLSWAGYWNKGYYDGEMWYEEGDNGEWPKVDSEWPVTHFMYINKPDK